MLANICVHETINMFEDSGSQTGGFQQGGFGGCSLDPQNRNKGTKKRTTVPKTGMRAQKPEHATKKQERGHIHQNHPQFRNRTKFHRVLQGGGTEWDAILLHFYGSPNPFFIQQTGPFPPFKLAPP